MREHSFDCLKKGCNSTKHQIKGRNLAICK